MPDTPDKLALIVSRDPLLVSDIESLLSASGLAPSWLVRATRCRRRWARRPPLT
jgi:hypothetical protein